MSNVLKIVPKAKDSVKEEPFELVAKLNEEIINSDRAVIVLINEVTEGWEIRTHSANLSVAELGYVLDYAKKGVV